MHVTSRLPRWIIYYILAYANKYASTNSKCASDKNWYCLWPSDTEYATSGMAVFISALSRGVSAKPEDIQRGIQPDWTCHLLYLDSLNAHSYVSTVFEIACIFHITGIWDNCVTCKRSFHICQLLLIPHKSTQYTFTGSSCLLCLLRFPEYEPHTV